MSKSPLAAAPVQLGLAEGVSLTGAPVTIPEILAAAREHAGRIAATSAMLALLFAAIALFLPKYYESSTRIFIDPRGLQLLEKDAGARAASSEQGTLLVESEMRVLYSDNVLRVVVKQQDLGNDAEFNGELQTLSRIADGFKSLTRALTGTQDEPTPRELKALRYLQQSIKVKREPQSYVVDLSVTTRDPHKSQRIANLIAKEYVQTRFSSESSATQRASDSMAARLDALRKAVIVAEQAVERYKADNNIVGASGRLVNEQQLAELNSQLVAARAEAAKAAEHYEQMQRIRRSGAEPDALPEALRSETLTRLRTQFASIRRREASLSVELLPSHPVLRQVSKEVADARRQISDELARIVETTRLEAERARANAQTLERNLEALKTVANSTNAKSVRLRELEREAEAHRAIYATFLTRSKELSEQRKIDTALATVLSPAVPPKGAKPPTLPHWFAIGAVLGLALGLHNAMKRMRADPRLRGEAQLRTLIGNRRFVAVPQLSMAVRDSEAAMAQRGQATRDGIPTFVQWSPAAPASAAMARLAAELSARGGSERPQVLLVTAAGDMEAKSTIAANLALAAAHAGDSVLLIDADHRGRQVTELAHNGANRPGLLDVAAGKIEGRRAVVKSQVYPLDILTVGTARDTRISQVRSAISSIAKPYDLVVIDGGVAIRDRLVSELAYVSTGIALVARQDVTNKADYQTALEMLDRGGKVRPVLVLDQ
ncbi:MAG: exopolysaccharide transport family protein [Hyphomicrobiaceae bacterium]